MSISVNAVAIKCDHKDCDAATEREINVNCRFYGVLNEDLKIACSEEVGLYWDIYEDAGELKVFCPQHQNISRTFDN